MSFVKSLVSKKKRRFNEGGFDLDLTYITENIIAMGFPAENMEGIFRNNMNDVVKFLDARHMDHYKVYNLCKERTYDKNKFHGRVSHYPFEDHNAPPLELMPLFCEDVHQWLSEDPSNIAVIHCKAGKGRTGVMICAYMLHCGMWKEAKDALDYYAAARTKNAKGVTIPSQARYVHYYQEILRGLRYQPVIRVLTGIKLGNSHAANIVVIVRMKNVIISKFEINQRINIPLCGDVKVEIVSKNLKTEKICHFWFNTCFIKEFKLRLNRNELDRVNKKMENDFYVDLIFSREEAATAQVKERSSSLSQKKKVSLSSIAIEEEEDSFENDVGEEEELNNCC